MNFDTELIFKWERGSLQRNAIKSLKKQDIEYYYNSCGQLTADLDKSKVFTLVRLNPLGEGYWQIVKA